MTGPEERPSEEDNGGQGDGDADNAREDARRDRSGLYPPRPDRGGPMPSPGNWRRFYRGVRL